MARAVDAGQDVGFRVMPAGSGQVDVPSWLIDEGLDGTHYGSGQLSPDYDDPLYLEATEALLSALGARYDGAPHLAFVDIGMMGNTGEWNLGPAADKGATLPLRASWERIIDAHIGAFPHTPVVMLLGDVDDGGEPVRYAVDHGAGWRADCLGDLGRGWNHMDDFYLQRIDEAGLGDVWKTAPVLFETCGTFPSWHRSGVDPECTLDYALALHTTSLNPKSKRVPRSYVSAVDGFQRRAGYRLRLIQVSVPATAPPSQAIQVDSRWLNQGVAPPYRPSRLAWRWQQQGGFTVTRTIQDWMPGETAVSDAITTPSATGPASLQVAILCIEAEDSSGDSARVPMGVAEVQDDGWYTVAQVQIQARR